MSGRGCKAAICRSMATAATKTMGEFIEDGLLVGEQQDDFIKCTDEYIKELNKIAEDIPDPE